ncbi:MAG: VWA domain-containing protein, partial [Myxococcota bacterium]
EIGQTFTFVIYTSGSKAGDKIEQARKTLAFCLSRLRPQDHFNVMRFSTDVEALFDNPRQASETAKSKGLTFARELTPAGGTAIGPALERALTQRVRDDQPHQVIFVTDGLPTVGQTDPVRIQEVVAAARAPKTRVFTFGVGYDVNTALLDGVAAKARGRADYIKPEEDMETAVAALYARVSSPVLTDITIDFGAARVYDVYPTPIPDLFRGDQVVLFGRMRARFSEPIRVTGSAGPELKEYVFGDSSRAKARRGTPSEAYAEPLEFLPKLWATRKVGYLLEQIRLHGEVPELKAEVLRLARKFGLVTPYTSYLAVDDSEFEPRQRLELEQREALRAPSKPTTAKRSPRTSNRRVARRRSSGQEKADAFKDFGSSTGEGSVAASEATREYKERDRVGDESGVTRRYVGGRTFVYADGVWTQDGVSTQGKRLVEVEAYSTAYFELVRAHRELRKIVALGGTILFELEGRVYRIVPAKKEAP